MKAYQLKVAIKNSKPLVWKRCQVPAGILFSQLALILEMLTETEENSQYEFEFFQKKIQIREWQGEASAVTRFQFEYRNALETSIDQLMEEESWFTFRRNVKPEYRCEIEKILEEEDNTPAVLKQKEDPDTCKWMDMDEMNQKLREWFHGEEKKQPDIQEKKPHGPFLRDYLSAYDREDLEHIAEEIHLENYKMMAETELAQKLAVKLLSPEIMEERLLMVSDASLDTLEAVLDRGSFQPDPEELKLLLPLYELDYLVVYEDEWVEVTADVAEAFSTLNTPEYRMRRKQQYWMWVCTRIVEMFYAAAPAEVVYRMYKQRSGFDVTYEKFLEIFESLSERYNHCLLHEGKIIAKEALMNKVYGEIEETQAGRSFYIPDFKEAEDYARHGYPTRDIWYRKLGDYLTDVFHVNMETRDAVLSVLWDHACMGEALAVTMDWMTETGFEFPSEDAYRRFLSLMGNAANNTRKLAYRGHTPEEVQGREGMFQPQILDGRSALNMGLTGAGGNKSWEKKIYPNDPCPCGSGKKYKKCCGKNK